MLKSIADQLKKEENQRLALHLTGMVVTLVATSVFSSALSKGIDFGIDSLMAKIHGTIEQAAG